MIIYYIIYYIYYFILQLHKQDRQLIVIFHSIEFMDMMTS